MAGSAYWKSSQAMPPFKRLPVVRLESSVREDPHGGCLVSSRADNAHQLAASLAMKTIMNYV